jgi:hypothetical protein
VTVKDFTYKKCEKGLIGLCMLHTHACTHRYALGCECACEHTHTDTHIPVYESAFVLHKITWFWMYKMESKMKLSKIIFFWILNL